MNVFSRLEVIGEEVGGDKGGMVGRVSAGVASYELDGDRIVSW
jgi:hypothetical protein